MDTLHALLHHTATTYTLNLKCVATTDGSEPVPLRTYWKFGEATLHHGEWGDYYELPAEITAYMPALNLVPGTRESRQGTPLGKFAGRVRISIADNGVVSCEAQVERGDCPWLFGTVGREWKVAQNWREQVAAERQGCRIPRGAIPVVAPAGGGR